MRITACELSAEADALERGFEALAAHVRGGRSDLVLLPEMPFFPWPCATREVDPAAWAEAVAAHERWISRLGDLGAPVVLGTRPVVRGGRRLNEGFVWTPAEGARAAHAKRYLPDEEGFWEASWYERGDEEFEAVLAGRTPVGFLICTELWFPERARDYGRRGVHLLACPRATPAGTREKWVAGGRTAAVLAGAYCLSSNHAGARGAVRFAGGGWAIEPEEGEVMGLTSAERPFLTVEIDPGAAERAKRTYPRYVS